jgi:hypothetical protein
MEYNATCVVCGERVGVGTVSSDVAQMAVVIHFNCLPVRQRMQIKNTRLMDFTLEVDHA